MHICGMTQIDKELYCVHSGYGVGRVHPVQGGIRRHSLCSCLCDQRQLVIELKQPRSFCIQYRRVVIAVSGKDYEALCQMLDAKFGIPAKTADI